MDSRFSTANGNLLKWPYESTPGDHAYTVESITESSWPAKHMPHLFHINQHISHLETQSGQMRQTHGRHRSSLFTKLYSKEVARKGSMEMSKSIYKHFSTTLKILKETYSVFRNSELHLAGSMGEQTKVVRPDEFDFVIILPQLSEIDIFWPDRMRKIRIFVILPKTLIYLDTRTHLLMRSDSEYTNYC
ncbi:unnamed protein product [Mytilus edulis]|uniref:Mab-21-like nucleotidyltransferase domain-containing protein n=1 Tax=Mytilus edulis TaxID=6550 RepID=A0A8S3SLY1_MYTED|nr:unnamed protein product [Mytilus edulis]